MKLIDARKDHYRKLAHEQGFRSRAAFKLKELNQSYRIIGPGFNVLDLGCAPGGWTQMAVKLTGNQGKVMGIDLSYVEEITGAYLIRENIEDEHVIDEIMSYFEKRINLCLDYGIPKSHIILDPGIGFGKQLNDNFILIRELNSFADLGYPILIGPSRKSFIGLTLDLQVDERLEGTAAAITASIINGARIVRVHDVLEMKRVQIISDKIRGAIA